MTAVAGDLYDFAVLGPARVGILVADVTGHGIPAALVASMVKIAFSAQSPQADNPAAVLAGMNRILCDHMERTYVTAIYAVIDAGRRTMSYANAGHPALLIGRSDSRVDASDGHGLMLGLTPDAVYANGQLDLHPGDSVLLFTDGIPETQNPKGTFLDVDGISDWLVSLRGVGVNRLADSLLQRLRDWRGAPAFEDDVTLVVARMAPPDSHS
jgi:serine phosphatase RsbU (regulator of sigma subunit)